jgi:uncharacterized membrane protein
MSPSLIVCIILLALGILAAVAHWFIPRLTRPDLYFAVTVAPGFRDSTEGRTILRRYRQGLSCVSALTLALLGALALTPAFPLAPLALLLQLGAYFGVFYRARQLVLPHTVSPTTVREAQIGQRNRRIPGGWVIASGPFALLAACASYLYTHWQQIPAGLVLHWGAHGQPDRWAPRSLGTVFFPLLIAAAILVAMTLILYGIAHWLRPIYAGGLEGAHESRFRRTTLTLLLAVEYWIAVLFSWLAIRPLLPALLQRPPAAIAFVPGLIAIAIVVVLMWLGQGGSRMPSPQRPEPDSTRPVGDRTEDRFWKLGVFYFDRDDPSVMVEKRFGIGYTMNFAHPVAWVIILLLVAVPIAFTTSIAVRHVVR